MLVGAVLASSARADPSVNPSVPPAVAARHRIKGLEQAVAVSRTQLAALQDAVRLAQTKLGALESLQQRDDQALAALLVDAYESGRPNLANVALQASGFDDAFQRLAFARSIAARGAVIVARVWAARRAVALQAARLGALSMRQQRSAAQELSDLDRVAAANAAVGSPPAASASGQPSAVAESSVTRSPPAAGSAMGFPLPRGDVAPPATWSLGDGVDMAAPGDTPELAVCTGTVVLHGIGGLGPSAPVLHCDSPIAGYGYVYYGDAGPGSWTPVGTHVEQGQVITQVGSGIVGNSTGPDLEIGFADMSGSPLGRASVARMMSLLRTAYGS